MTSSVLVPGRVVADHSKFWVRKQLTYFRLFDIARSGIVSDTDVYRRCDERTNEVFGQDEVPQVHPVSRKLWDEVFRPAASYTTSFAQVPWESFIKQRSRAALENKSADMETFHDIIDSMFHLADLNKDGVIQRPEYIKLMATLGLDDNRAFTSFSAVDLNKDDIISATEFRRSMIHFLYGYDGRGSRVLGDLVPDEIVPFEDNVASAL